MEQISFNDTKDKIIVYVNHIDKFRMEINTQGIWLFLGTLGCWSVGQPFIQIVAISTLLFIFSHLVNSELKDNRSFPRIEKDLEEQINTQSEAGLKNKLLDELQQAKNYRKSIKKIMNESKMFIVCYLFYGLSVMYFTANFFNITVF